jgi:hypothetical protein
MKLRRLVLGVAGTIGAILSLAWGAQAADPIGPVPSPSPAATVAPVPPPSPLPVATPAVRPLLPGFPAAGASSPPAQPYATFVRGADRQTGVIDLIRKDDQLYLDLRPENFGRPYIILPSIASGVGGDAFAGRIYDPVVVIFKRVGRRVLWVTPNNHYVADKGTSAAASLAVSVADSVIQVTNVVAEDEQKTHVVVEPTFFLSDFEGIGADLGRGVKSPSLPGLLIISIRPSFSVDGSKSFYLSTKTFERNDEISVNLTFNGPANAFPAVPDGRGIPIVVHYSIVAPPPSDQNYIPRYADDRVGYFTTVRKHFGDDVSTVPTQRFIDRWNIAAGPIVYTLTNEIPPAYRATVRRGILAWNVAFAKLGYPHAIVVHDPPTDPAFDPEDARYNSVRWITSESPDFVAISPHVADPDTGQIIRAEVVIDGEAVRSVRRGYVDRVVPILRAGSSALAMPVDQQENTADQAALGMQALIADPHASPKSRDDYAQAFLYWTVMHEVGHTLGLRHNFEGSTAFTYAQLHDPAFTQLHGTTGSVMDYIPANIAPPGQRQADYYPNRLGVYDNWAIDYGYAPVPKARTSNDELPKLHAIAAQSTLRGYAYGTDEDASSPTALDPRIQRYDLSSDPLAFAGAQFAVNATIAANLTRSFRGDTRSYQDLRQTLVTVLNNDLANVNVAARYIGGMYTSRSHRGQPGGEAPFRVIPRTEQRRAFELIDRYVLGAKALRFSPQLLDEVLPQRYGTDWSTTSPPRTDFPMREIVAQLQDAALSAMFNTAALSRIANGTLKETHPGETMNLADLFTWTNAAIFDDLGAASIPPEHRDEQRRFTDLELQIALLSSGAMDQLGLPREIQSLARYELRGVRSHLDRAIAAASDIATKAHLDDLRSRIDGGLAPTEIRPL